MKIIDKIVDIFSYIASFLVIVLTILVVYDSTNRYIFSGGEVYLQELEWHLFDIIFLLGISYTLKSDKHVRVDIFYNNYSEKTKAIINIISNIFLILPFTILIIYVSYNFIYLSYTQHEISPDPGGLHYRWLIKSMIIVGFVLLGLQSIAEIIKNIRKLK